ncbi:hypothetical protein [Flavobacterium sp. NKUCC04_CG]|uniref:hypothetical protein n=1 Tax=Flavobacterium sp. NKUCC04_CG TaxID=2842121 RepID=UPI001C5ADA01|nr:hypothetical protein [Flavobacterium sp. NKUCC04_CG]MBW3518911.1 hypothetical protein [Flavobacterium sp. NKUCC04_CG]
MQQTNNFTVTILISIWLCLSVALFFIAVFFTVSGNPDLAGTLYITSLLSTPISAVALGLQLRKKSLQ